MTAGVDVPVVPVGAGGSVGNDVDVSEGARKVDVPKGTCKVDMPKGVSKVDAPKGVCKMDGSEGASKVNVSGGAKCKIELLLECGRLSPQALREQNYLTNMMENRYNVREGQT